jgi:hypothetical protein
MLADPRWLLLQAAPLLGRLPSAPKALLFRPEWPGCSDAAIADAVAAGARAAVRAALPFTS